MVDTAVTGTDAGADLVSVFFGQKKKKLSEMAQNENLYTVSNSERE
jgi:hypothetical protein